MLLFLPTDCNREKRLNSSVLLHFPTNLTDNPWNSAEVQISSVFHCVNMANHNIFFNMTVKALLSQYQRFLQLWKLCTPGGLTVELGDSPPQDAHFHSFVITREDGTRTYGHALTFLEPCVNPRLESDIMGLYFLIF